MTKTQIGLRDDGARQQIRDLESLVKSAGQLEASVHTIGATLAELESRISGLERRVGVPTFQVEQVDGYSLLVVCGGQLTPGSVERLAAAARGENQDAHVVLEIESEDGALCARYRLDGTRVDP